ncbi:MAG: hypothetical protein KGL53_15355, partial [Elusimicrobia bacterium]|nr:hypothetical protein [Elusimicrobiota bacterium]
MADLPLKDAPQRPWATRVFDFNLRESVGDSGMFKVTKDMKYEAIRLELEKEATGGRPGTANPYEYYRISQQDGGMAGRLHVTDEVRDQAQGLFEKSMLQDTALAEKILKAEPGKKLPGYGRVRLSAQEEVARILYANRDSAGVTKAQAALAEGELKPNIETERHVLDAGTGLLKAASEVTEPTKAYRDFFKSMLDRTSQWKADTLAGRPAPDYMSLLKDFKASADRSQMAPAEKTVIARMTDYFQAIEDRLNRFNTVKTASSRAERALGALVNEANDGGAASPLVAQRLKAMMQQVSDWRDSQPDQGARVGKSFDQLIEAMSDGLHDLDGKVSKSDMALLNRAVKEVKSSSALLRNPKGDGLLSWRPEQFEGMMQFMDLMAAEGRNSSKFIRDFLRMKTGGGKTMLAFEGILPIAEADSTLHGGKKLKPIFLTVQSNLESQACLDYRALKQVLTKVDIDTWEGFKTRIAQNKLEAKGGADEYWILGDEMDGAALQPALTIGEQNAGISQEAPGYRYLKNIGLRLNQLLDRGPGELQRAVRDEARRQQGLVDSMEPGKLQDQLRSTTEDIVRLSDGLPQLAKRGDEAGLARAADRITKVLQTQKRLLAGVADPAAQGIGEAGDRITKTLADRADVARPDIDLARKLVKRLMAEQRSVLNQTAPEGVETA